MCARLDFYKRKKICPLCEKEKFIEGFHLIDENEQLEELYCCILCYNTLDSITQWCDRVLEDVYIPEYNTPIKKYKISDSPTMPSYSPD